MYTYWKNDASKDPKSSSWDWSADPKQVTILLKAKARGVYTFEAFASSPPWWITNSLATAGGYFFKSDSLKENYRKKFAVYLATVVDQARERWGINFDYVQPFIEPSGPWWNFPWVQEGCIAAFDENSPCVTYNQIQKMSSARGEIFDIINKISTHGYFALLPYRGPYRGPLYEQVSSFGKRMWNSEHVDFDRSGLTTAISLGYDFNDLHLNGVSYWLGFGRC